MKPFFNQSFYLHPRIKINEKQIKRYKNDIKFFRLIKFVISLEFYYLKSKYTITYIINNDGAIHYYITYTYI